MIELRWLVELVEEYDHDEGRTYRSERKRLQYRQYSGASSRQHFKNGGWSVTTREWTEWPDVPEVREDGQDEI